MRYSTPVKKTLLQCGVSVKKVIVYLNQHFGSRLSRRIRIRWLKRGLLTTRRAAAVAGFAVNFIRAHVNKAFDRPTETSRFEECVRSQNIILGKRETVAEAVVHVRLPRQSNEQRMQRR